jgi:signal transduction histidine kinase
MTFPRWVPPASRAVMVVLVAAALVDAANDGELTAVRIAAGALAVTSAWMSGLLATEERAFAAALAAALAGPCIFFLADGDPASVAWLALVFLCGQVGVTLRFVPGLVAFSALASVIGAAAIAGPSADWASWGSSGLTGYVGGALFRKQAELAERSQAAESASERARIAGELHDVVAHTLAVTVLHLGAARVAVEHEPERAADALAEAERLARSSMAELRRVVGALADGNGADLPAPGAAEVLSLVDDYRRGGVDVTVRVEGDLTAVDGPRGLVLYRVVQEALANAVRHAPGAPIVVDLAVTPARVNARIANPRPAGVGAADPGHGLAGMAARASAVGGSAVAAADGDRWIVMADLPGG